MSEKSLESALKKCLKYRKIYLKMAGRLRIHVDSVYNLTKYSKAIRLRIYSGEILTPDEIYLCFPGKMSHRTHNSKHFDVKTKIQYLVYVWSIIESSTKKNFFFSNMQKKKWISKKSHKNNQVENGAKKNAQEMRRWWKIYYAHYRCNQSSNITVIDIAYIFINQAWAHIQQCRQFCDLSCAMGRTRRIEAE